jgi:hypothetical protein
MRTAEEVEFARIRICRMIKDCELNQIQLALLRGTLNALIWVANDGPGAAVVHDLLFSNEPSNFFYNPENPHK